MVNVTEANEDLSGVSGTGVVAEGIEFTDRSVAVRWLGDRPSTCAWGSIEDVRAIHGHKGLTDIEWAAQTQPRREQGART